MHPLIERRFIWVLTTICCVAAVITTWSWFAGATPPPIRETIALDAGATDDSLAALDDLSQEAFKAMADRPLFIAARRPPPTAAKAGAGPAATDGVVFGRYKFTGIVYTPRLKLAFVTELDTKRSLTVNEGEILGEWTFTEIGRGSITLQSGTRRETILLRGNP
jgi:hypothetical protein